MTSDLPDSARMAWWCTAWLHGTVGADDALAAVIGDDAGHDVLGLPGTDGLTPLALGLGGIRATGATHAGLALPAEGDPVGLGGPRELSVAATEAGQAVVLGPLLPGQTGWGLVPHRAGRGVVWQALPALRRQLVDVGQADRDLRAALRTTTDALVDLDVARWGPEVADELMALRRVAPPDAPDGVPARCVELATRAVALLAVVDLALPDTGGESVTARRAALEPLGRAARRALVAACSPEAWP